MDKTSFSQFSQEKKILDSIVKSYKIVKQKFADGIVLTELAESDNSLLGDIQQYFYETKLSAEDLFKRCVFKEVDDNDCFIEINAGAGGVDSCDWTSMLLRMYLKFSSIMDFKTEVISASYGEGATVKSACIKVSGDMSYGWLKTESGVHKLIRVSPFNATKKRMTSFASCFVYPKINDSVKVVICSKDIKIDTYRSSGAGGQHVNTTDSAVRITHIPTNIVTQCQNYRSQHRNKAQALTVLRSRLYKLYTERRNERIASTYCKKLNASWGNSVRSYILHPYQLVKDLRTHYKTSNVTNILNGNLKELILTALISNKYEYKK